jgi:hypothetical protein
VGSAGKSRFASSIGSALLFFGAALGFGVFATLSAASPRRCRV